MDSAIYTVIFGILIILLGISNIKGNISSVHWYHRKRITDENRLSFGKTIGLGTVICGVSLVIFGCLVYVAQKTQAEIFMTIGYVIIIIGIISGIVLSFYAMFKYNKGIF